MSPRPAATIVAAALALVVLVEGSGFGIDRGGEALAGYPHPTVPKAPAGLAGLRAAGFRTEHVWSSPDLGVFVSDKSSVVYR